MMRVAPHVAARNRARARHARQTFRKAGWGDSLLRAAFAIVYTAALVLAVLRLLEPR